MPTVITCHDLINFYYPQNCRGTVSVPLLSRSLWKRSIWGMKKADHVVAVSQTTANDVTKILDILSERITVIPDAVEGAFRPLSPEVRQTVRQRWGRSPQETCLLNVGTNHPRKNISTILRVLDLLQRQQQPVHFWKVGEDFNPEQKAWIQSAGLESHVSYLGKPDKQTLVQLYGAADALLTPSTHEGFGMTMLEAMACGTPVIASNTSALPEVTGDAALLVDPMNVEAIAQMVLTLRQNQWLYQEMVHRGLERVKGMNWEAIAEQVAQLYSRVIAQRSGTAIPDFPPQVPIHT